jgi:hypothetical protein
MRGEAACSLACIYLTIVLFVGSLIYKLWHGGWWVDSVVAILLGCFFLHEGWEMIAWARHKDFNGGCCKTCSGPPATIYSTDATTFVTECSKMEKGDCCSNNTECIEDGTAVCSPLLAKKTPSTDAARYSDPV